MVIFGKITIFYKITHNKIFFNILGIRYIIFRISGKILRKICIYSQNFFNKTFINKNIFVIFITQNSFESFWVTAIRLLEDIKPNKENEEL